MASSRVPNASEVLDLLDRLQRSETGRPHLQAGWEIYRAAVEDGVIGSNGIDWLARSMQELCEEELIAYRSQSAGGLSLPAVWDGSTIQRLHEWRVTASGRRDAQVFRNAMPTGTEDAWPRAPHHAAVVEDQRVEGHDVFVSHASEDKQAIARPLAGRLREQGYRVWFDEFELRLGMSLRRSIDKGLAGSRYGVVILSSAFFGKEWPERELDGLAARETTDGRHLILPIWHGVDKQDVAAYSPTLADRVAAKSADGLDVVVAAIVDAIGPPDSAGSAGNSPDVRLSPMPTTVELTPVLVGVQLMHLIDAAYEMVFELDRLPHGLSRRQAAELFDDLRDRGEVLNELGLAERDRWEEELSGEIKELLDAGVVIFGGSYVRMLESSKGTDRWPGAVIRAIPLSEAQQRSEPQASAMSADDATVIALAQVLIEKGDRAGAEGRLTPLAEKGNGYAMLLLGMLLRDDGRPVEAAEMLRRARDAGRREALTPLGLVLQELGELDEAESALTQAATEQSLGDER